MFTVDIKQQCNLMSQRVDLDEVAHYEPAHLDLRCLQIQLFSLLVLKGLNIYSIRFMPEKLNLL